MSARIILVRREACAVGETPLTSTSCKIAIFSRMTESWLPKVSISSSVIPRRASLATLMTVSRSIINVLFICDIQHVAAPIVAGFRELVERRLPPQMESAHMPGCFTPCDAHIAHVGTGWPLAEGCQQAFEDLPRPLRQHLYAAVAFVAR